MGFGSRRPGSWDRERREPTRDELWGSLLWTGGLDSPGSSTENCLLRHHGLGQLLTGWRSPLGVWALWHIWVVLLLLPVELGQVVSLLWHWRSFGQKAKRCVACSWNDRLSMKWVWAHMWSFVMATAEMRGGLEDVILPPGGFATQYKWDFPPKPVLILKGRLRFWGEYGADLLYSSVFLGCSLQKRRKEA